MKKIFKSKMFLAFILSFVLGCLIVLPNMIVGKGIYSLTSDYNLQQVPFNMIMSDAVKEGSFLWNWYNELGSNFIGTFSFYNLFSPFSLIMYLFPISLIPYLNGIFMILKYGIAGLTSYLFLKRYFKDYKYAIIGSLLYTFSGFHLNNILFHFSDVIALFPLLLYTLDNYMYDNKKGWFFWSVFILACTNWFFFIGQGVFFVLYFLVKLICKEYKFDLKKIGWLVVEGVLGIGAACFVLMPSMLFMLGNPRLGSSWNLVSMLRHPFFILLEILKAFIFPNEVMHMNSFIVEANYASVEIFLPLVGSLLLIGCLIKNYKKWYSVLFIVGFIFMIIPILNSSFFLFNSMYYARWYYMLILIMSLMSCKCLEDKVKLKLPLVLNIGLYFILFIGVLLYIFRFDNSDIIFQPVYFYLMIIMGIICLIYTYIVCSSKVDKYLYLVVGIFIFVFIWGNYTTYCYSDKSLDNSYYHNYLDISKVNILENSRSNSYNDCLYNLGCVGRFNNVKGFNSNINGSNFEFYYSIGYPRTVSTIINDDRINDYLGVKYYISCGEESDLELVYEDKNYLIYLNPGYKEFGFNKDKYMSIDDFNKLDVNDRINALSNYVILNEEQIDKYKDVIKEVDYNSNEFKFTKNGFSSVIDSSDDAFAIYTVPYDKGFRAFINNKEVDIEKVDNGMMGIKINKGINNTEFKYFTPGLKIGIIGSIISFILYGFYLLLIKFKKVI